MRYLLDEDIEMKNWSQLIAVFIVFFYLEARTSGTYAMAKCRQGAAGGREIRGECFCTLFINISIL